MVGHASEKYGRAPEEPPGPCLKMDVHTTMIESLRAQQRSAEANSVLKAAAWSFELRAAAGINRLKHDERCAGGGACLSLTRAVVMHSCFLGCLVVLLVLAAAFLGMQGGKQGLHTKRMLLLTSKACVRPEWKGLQTMEDKVCTVSHPTMPCNAWNSIDIASAHGPAQYSATALVPYREYQTLPCCPGQVGVWPFMHCFHPFMSGIGSILLEPGPFLCPWHQIWCHMGIATIRCSLASPPWSVRLDCQQQACNGCSFTVVP